MSERDHLGRLLGSINDLKNFQLSNLGNFTTRRQQTNSFLRTPSINTYGRTMRISIDVPTPKIKLNMVNFKKLEKYSHNQKAKCSEIESKNPKTNTKSSIKYFSRKKSKQNSEFKSMSVHDTQLHMKIKFNSNCKNTESLTVY